MTPSDIFLNSVNSVLNSLHTATPGQIVSYDHTQNKAIVQPLLNKAYKTGSKEMPLLNNVPIVFPKGIYFPILPGDNVLLIFCERSIDLWKSVGGQVTPDDPRKFDLNDAVAIPVLQTFNADFSQNNGTDFSINFNGSKISISQNGDVQIKTGGRVAIGNITTELLQVLSDTLNLLTSLTAVPAIPSSGSPPQPLNIAGQALILKNALDLIKGTIT